VVQWRARECGGTRGTPPPPISEHHAPSSPSPDAACLCAGVKCADVRWSCATPAPMRAALESSSYVTSAAAAAAIRVAICISLFATRLIESKRRNRVRAPPPLNHPGAAAATAAVVFSASSALSAPPDGTARRPFVLSPRLETHTHTHKTHMRFFALNRFFFAWLWL